MSTALSWLAVWALAAGWLLLVNFFLPSDPRGWAFTGLGLLLFIVASRRVRWRRIDPWLYLLALPLALAAAIWPGPHRAGPLLLLGALFVTVPQRRASWLAPLSLGLGLAGAVWIAQSAAVVAYGWLGAHHHEAPVLTSLLYALAKGFGWTVGSSEGSLFLPHMDGVVQATATWERLGAFPALLLAAGGCVLLPLAARHGAHRWIGRLAAALGVTLGYLLLRYLALTALFAISQEAAIFWLPLSMAATFLPLSLVLSRLVPLQPSPLEPLPAADPGPVGRYAALAGAAFVAGLAIVGVLTFHDPGRQKEGRVLLDEYNSNWEWTTQVLDTAWYGQKSGYNYYSLGQWLKYYYQVDTNFQPRTAGLLAGYDVLIIKTPTAPFTPDEIDAIEAWVRAGGGLFLIGDHTNVFGTSSYLNPLARRFGLRFRYDSTYDLSTLRVTLYQRPRLLAHPAVLDIPPFLFATSCTLQAPLLADNVMVGYGLRALPVDYSSRVFFPDKEKERDYPFGLFLQSAAVAYGRGRVVAFTDSTVFSNFTMFIAGKPEYFLGVMNWLNRSERWPWLDSVGLLLAVLAAVTAVFLARGLDRRRATVTVLGALLLSAALGPWSSLRLAEASYRSPAPHAHYPRISFEAEHSRLALPTTPAAVSPDVSFQTFYVWTQRLGYVPSFRPTLEQALESGSVLVLVDPARSFEPSEVALVEEFVARGGRLLVLAEPRTGDSASNQILAPFGLGVDARRATTGVIHNGVGEPQGELQVSGVVSGGEPLLTLEGLAPVAAWARHGDGLVAVTAFARLFSDREMGTTSVIPNTHQRFLYEIEFWLLRNMMSGEFSPLEPPLKTSP
jgi:hypothetical protein